jgi:putative chitinase
MHLLTIPYTVEALSESDTATAKGINNTPPDAIAANMVRYLIPGLLDVRNILGHDLWHSSGYRCMALNHAVGGSVTSAHMQGYAEDFVCPDFGSPLEIVQKIQASGHRLDQCIQEGTWVHISFEPRLRQQFETAHFDAEGHAAYTPGV